MSIVFSLFLLLNVANPENRAFFEQALANHKQYNCTFVFKGISAPKDRPAITMFGYTAFKQICKK